MMWQVVQKLSSFCHGDECLCTPQAVLAANPTNPIRKVHSSSSQLLLLLLLLLALLSKSSSFSSSSSMLAAPASRPAA
eukprot:3197570-Prorocentrum_lima.AAC.1